MKDMNYFNDGNYRPENYRYVGKVNVPRKDARQVARRTAVGFMPVELKILGLTARMYAMVIKVVTPAMHSVFTLV